MNKTITLFMLMLFASVNAFAQISDAKKKEIESQYDFVYWYTLSKYQFIEVKKNGKFGALDKNGKMIIPCQFDFICQHDNRYYSVKLNGKKGIFDLNGKMLLDFKYTDVSWHMTKKYIGCNVELDGKKGFISTQGDVMIPCEYDDISFYPESEKDYIATVKKNGKIGKYDTRKKTFIIPCEYEDITYFPKSEKDIYATVKKDGYKGIYDVSKKLFLVPCRYDKVYYYPSSDKDYWAHIEKNGQSGIYDVQTGKEKIPCIYTYIMPISESKAIVCEGGMYDSDKFVLTQNGKWGCIDINSLHTIIPCQYDYLGIAGENLFRYNIGGSVSKPYEDPIGGLWGMLDANNNIIYKPEYTQLSSFKDGVAQAVKDGVATILVDPLKGTNMVLANGVNSSTIDQNIPQTTMHNENAFAFIFANENYKNGANADFSINDGKIFAKYCQQTLGLPENNVKYYEDATFGNFQSALKKVKDIADVYDGEAKIIFYYSGLGNTVDGKRYILPSDVSLASTKVTAISVDNILSTLNALNTTYTLALFDAPFNGTDKSGKMLETARGVKIKSKAPVTTGKVVAVFGSSDDKNNYVYKKCAHGLFTYNLLEQLQQSKGNGVWKSLIENANSKVDKDALKEFNDIQKPQIIVSDMITNDWQNLKF